MDGFRPGDLIYRSKPYVCILEEREKGNRCDNCFTEQPGLKRCSQCSLMYFCDQACQIQAWTGHKLECKLMKRSSKPLPKSLLLISRILLKIKKYGIQKPVEDVWGNKVDFDRLMSHTDTVSDENVKTATEILSHYFQDLPISTSNLREIISKVRTNAFSILNPECRTIGGALYLGGSLFDHSCEPNAEVVFEGTEMIIRAVKEIPLKDITKIHISYIDVMQFTEDRQKYLDEQYHFTCMCSRCTSPHYDDLLTKTVMEKSQCESLVKEFKEKVATIKQMKSDKACPGKIYELCLLELQKQNDVLANTHLYRIKILEYIFDACIDNNQWTDAVIFGEELLKSYRLLYGKYQPELGIHLFKLGKIHNLLERSDSAKQYLLQAEEIFKITYGQDHSLYNNLVYDNLCFL